MMKFSKIIFPDFEVNLRVRLSDCGERHVFDALRKCWIKLTPEEWVRQNILQYLINHKGYPHTLISCETSIEYNGMTKRCDAIVYNHQSEPILIMEFKAQNVKLSQDVFDQISIYNMALNVPYLFVSNGKEHIFCKVDQEHKRLLYSDSIPFYSQL